MIDHPDRQYLQEALAKSEEFCIQVNIIMYVCLLYMLLDIIWYTWYKIFCTENKINLSVSGIYLYQISYALYR